MKNPQPHKSFENDNRNLCEFIRGRGSVMVAYGSAPGRGGLGHSVASAIDSIRRLTPRVTAYGPDPTPEQSDDRDGSPLVWKAAPRTEPSGISSRFWLRRRQGKYVW